MKRPSHTATRFALCCVCIALLLGCVSAPKHTWNDWLDADAPKAHTRALPALTPPPANSVAYAESYRMGDGAKPGQGYDLAMRNPDFPRTYISQIHLDLTSPAHRIQLVWAGPDAAKAPIGPWRSCPGRGKPGVDCNDQATSNVVDSFCTPKGTFRVAGFSDHLERATQCHYTTWVVHAPRYIAMHSFGDIASTPRSEGCVRLEFDVAKLIHNNAIAGVTLIHISGRWVRGVD